MIASYQKLIVWQRAISLVLAVYEITRQFPKEVTYVLSIQMRRSAISIPSNIAEGKFRFSKKEYLQFLKIAYGSGAELETQLVIAQRLPHTGHLSYKKVHSLLQEVMKMLNVILRKIAFFDNSNLQKNSFT